MKKRLLAMCLVLALALSMMVPVFAAMQPRACSHTVWQLNGTSVRYENCSNVSYHYAWNVYVYRCPDCGATKTADYGSRWNESHKLPCGKCGMATRMALEE